MNWHDSWVEILFWTLFGFGIIIALALHSELFSYLVIFMIGLLAGRIIYQRKGMLNFKVYLLIAGLILGWIIGDLWGYAFTTIILFILGAVLSYMLHSNRWADRFIDHAAEEYHRARRNRRQNLKQDQQGRRV